MEWVKLSTSFHNDAAVTLAGEAAEVLFVRALSYCGDQETDGFIPKEMVARLSPVRSAARAKALVKAGLWEPVDGGWRFTRWDKHQKTRDQMDASRASGRKRQANYRARNAVTPPVSDGVTNASRDPDVTLREVEEEVDAAAAAAALPGDVDVLRAKLQAHTPLRGLRFDSLTDDQVARVSGLLRVHGDDPLVAVAIATCRNPAPVHASAFLGTWEALPAPGTRLAAVRPKRCHTHDTQLSPSGTCSACSSEQIASDR